MKLNFENSTLAAGWDENKEKDNSCVILRDKEGKQYLAVMKYEDTTIFRRDIQNTIYTTDGSDWKKMIYKLVPGASKTLPKIFFSKKWADKNSIPTEINRIKKIETFKKGDNFDKDDLHKLIDFYKENLKKYPSKDMSWNDLFEFNFSKTDSYESIDQFYGEVDKQGYKLNFVWISKTKLDELVESGKVYFFEIYNHDNDYYYDRETKERKKKNLLKGSQNLQTIYWNTIFNDVENRPKLNGEAEIFYRPAISPDKLGKKKDKSGKEVVDHRRFLEEKFVFHCPITLNFGSKSSRLNDEINKIAVENKDEVCFIGIDRGEKHLAYYSMVNQKGEILQQGSFNLPFLDKDGKQRSVKAERYFDKDKKENEEWKPRIVDCWSYNDLLEARASNRDLARKNWKTIGTIKELKDGYISQVVREIVDLAIYKDKDKKELREVPAYIVLENLSGGFKNSRKKIEKSVYQKLELALAKKLNFIVDKKAKEGDICSVQKALQLTPLVNNFSDIEKCGGQFGIMLYIRANYTSQTDPLTGWRKTVRFDSTTQENLKKELDEKFDEIGFDGQDYYFKYTDKNTGKPWILWSGGNGRELERFKWNNQTKKIEQKHIIKELEKTFGKQTSDSKDLKSKITENNVKDLKFAIDLIQQIRNTGTNEKDNDFILSPVRDGDGINGNHFDSRENEVIVPNGDANGAYNIARKGIMAFERIKDKPEKPDLYIEDQTWDAAVSDWDGFVKNNSL